MAGCIPDKVDFAKIDKKRCKHASHHVEARVDLGIASCGFCSEPTSNYCTSCFLKGYCTEKHWKDDQENHSKICGKEGQVTFVADETNKVPPHYVFSGTYNIPKGTPLMSEEPFAIFPTLPIGYSEDKERSLVGLKRICYKCHDHFYLFTPAQNTVCGNCGIWWCSFDCDGLYHSVQECVVIKRFFSQKNLIQSYSSSMRKYIEFYLDVCVLRILVFFSYAETYTHLADQWKRFRLLSTTPRFKHLKKTTRDPFDGICYMEFMKKSVDILKCSLAFANFNREVVKQVYKTMIVFWDEYEATTNIMSRILLEAPHFMQHSYCSPNIATIISHDSSKYFPSWNYYTLKNIPKGSPVKLMFDFSPRRFMPLPLRIMYLNDIGLQCQSPRCTTCKDSTDGGTNSGSVVCLSCHEGIYVEHAVREMSPLLSNFPERWSPEYVKNVDWKCNSCEHVQPFSKILEINQACSEEWRNAMRIPARYSVISAAIKFIDTYEFSVLHQHNGLLLQVKYDFLMGMREKHFWECGLDAIGRELPLPDLTKFYTSRGGIVHKKKKSAKLRLFPITWNANECELTVRRATYANECLQFLENTNPMCFPFEYSEYLFLKVEYATTNLLVACYSFFCCLDEESATQFVAAARSLALERDSWDLRRVLMFRLSPGNYPLLKWSDELDLVVKMRKKDSRPIAIAETIFKLMRISVGQFVLGGGKFADQRRQEGASMWPLQKIPNKKSKEQEKQNLAKS